MSDPLSQIMALLRPRTVLTKGISGAGSWAVRYSDFGLPSFCAVLEGSCLLALDGAPPAMLEAGDFVLLPATPGFVLSSGAEFVEPVRIDPHETGGATDDVRHGRVEGAAEVRLLGGYFILDSADHGLLTSLLPRLVLMREAGRQAELVRMLRQEAVAGYAGRDVVLARLVEVLLVEAIRTASVESPKGLLRGMADPRIGQALRLIHANPARSWSVGELASQAGLSRSAFFDRFTRTVGVPPMEYLLGWRMAIARDLLRDRQTSIAEVAERTGYGSPSAFSIAFAREVGISPGRYARGAPLQA